MIGGDGEMRPVVQISSLALLLVAYGCDAATQIENSVVADCGTRTSPLAAHLAEVGKPPLIPVTPDEYIRNKLRTDTLDSLYSEEELKCATKAGDQIAALMLIRRGVSAVTVLSLFPSYDTDVQACGYESRSSRYYTCKGLLPEIWVESALQLAKKNDCRAVDLFDRAMNVDVTVGYSYGAGGLNPIYKMQKSCGQAIH